MRVKAAKSKPVVSPAALEEQAPVVIRNGCPRKPDTPICGYSGIDERGRKYDTCTLPRYHSGPHGQVEKPQVSVKVPRRELQIRLLPIEIDGIIPEQLTNVIYGWHKTGNQWATCLEVELELFSRGMKLSTTVDDTGAVRTLLYLGYMDKRVHFTRDLSQTTQYRLSRKGLRTALTISKLTGDTDDIEPVVHEEDEEQEDLVECWHCEGSGTYDGQEECPCCLGKGLVVKPAECPDCEGVGLIDGDECPRCEGSGEWREALSPPEKPAAPVQAPHLKIRRRAS